MVAGIQRALGVLLAALVLAATPAKAEWLRAESAHFIVYSQSREPRLREQVALLEEYRELLRGLTGAPAAAGPGGAKLSIYMLRGTGQMNRIIGNSQGLAGFYTASPDGIVAVIDEGLREDWTRTEEVLLHEYAHHFMLQYFPAAYPAWYVEGFAEYLATARLEPEIIEYGRPNEGRASWLADRSGWLPFGRIFFSDPSRLRGPEVSKYYAQSWLIVHYLMRDPERRRQLSAYLQAVVRGEEPRAAFAAAFGTNPSAMQRAVSRYAVQDLSYSRGRRAAAAAASEIRIEPLGAWAGDLLLDHVTLLVSSQSNPDLYMRGLRRRAAPHGEPAARRILARAEALYGDGAAADALLDSLLRDAPGDAELLFLKGLRHLVAGRRDADGRAAHYRTAQAWFARAHAADPDHYPTLYRYAESLSLEPEFLGENTRNILLLAAQLAPQVEEIGLRTANLLMRRGEFAEAASILAPLAANPHRRPLVAAAETLLAMARAGDAAGLPGVFDDHQPLRAR
jgi:hypothetical protein